MQVSSSLQLEKQCQASCRVDHRDQWLSLEVPQGCHSCHRVGVDPQGDSRVSAGNQVSLEWIGTSGPFGIVTRPLEFLSSFKLRPPPLEMRRERRDSFPDEAGK